MELGSRPAVWPVVVRPGAAWGVIGSPVLRHCRHRQQGECDSCECAECHRSKLLWVCGRDGRVCSGPCGPHWVPRLPAWNWADATPHLHTDSFGSPRIHGAAFMNERLPRRLLTAVHHRYRWRACMSKLPDGSRGTEGRICHPRGPERAPGEVRDRAVRRSGSSAA
jgi:hypothetical protein